MCLLLFLIHHPESSSQSMNEIRNKVAFRVTKALESLHTYLVVKTIFIEYYVSKPKIIWIKILVQFSLPKIHEEIINLSFSWCFLFLSSLFKTFYAKFNIQQMVKNSSAILSQKGFYYICYINYSVFLNIFIVARE